MPNTKFLEEYPLYKRFAHTPENWVHQIPKVPIHMHCKVCRGEQTFNMSNAFTDYYDPGITPVGKVFLLRYLCSACKRHERQFLIMYASDYIMKVGQQPPWEITIEKALSQVLGIYADDFKKGLVCESQGYGVGAYAYYRRIVEGVIDELLNSITELIEPNEIEKYKLALEETKKTRVVQDKIKLVKDLLPSSLKPSGINPLDILHSTLSEGLHDESDEACLEIAGNLRDIIKYLFDQIVRHREAQKGFTDSMRKMLDKKKGKGSS